MEDPQERRPNEGPEGSTAARVEDWLRNLRAQRASGAETAGRAGRGGGSGEDPAEAFLRAARRLASSPRAQEARARQRPGGAGSRDRRLAEPDGRGWRRVGGDPGPAGRLGGAAPLRRRGGW